MSNENLAERLEEMAGEPAVMHDVTPSGEEEVDEVMDHLDAATFEHHGQVGEVTGVAGSYL